MKRGGLGILDPWLSAEHEYNTSKAASKFLVGSLLGGTDLNYVTHKACVCRESADGRNQHDISEKAVLKILKELTDRTGFNRLHQAMENGA